LLDREHGLHDATEFGGDEFREDGAFGQEPTQIAVEGGLIDHAADAAAVGFRLVPSRQIEDRVRLGGCPPLVEGLGYAASAAS
jgi:hypothetical protein